MKIWSTWYPKYLLGTCIGICLTFIETLTNGSNIIVLFAAQMDLALPPSPKESLSHLHLLCTDWYFLTQLLSTGLFWNSLGENSHNPLHHYYPKMDWDCSINTFPLHTHNILMRRRGWLSHRLKRWISIASPTQLWGQRERQCLQKSKQIFETVSLPVSEKPAHLIPFLLMTLASEIGPFSGSPKHWQSPKCQGLGELIGVRCPKGQGSQPSESLLSSGVSKVPVSCGDTELQMSVVGTLQPQPPGCSNSLGSFSAALQWLITTSQPGFMGRHFHSSHDWIIFALWNKRPSSDPEHPSLVPHKRGFIMVKIFSSFPFSPE